MISNKTFGIIGGDLRQIEVAEILKKNKNHVLIHGFNKLKNHENIQESNLENLILKSDYIILPVPITRDKINLNCDFNDIKINLEKDLFSNKNLKSKIIFGGIISDLENYIKKYEICIKDYYIEEFILQNALITAEGAVQIALEKSGRILNNSKCLVTGYGRIGKILSKMLKNLGAQVFIYTKNLDDTSWAKINNYEVINIKKLTEKVNFDFVFNTVPEIILDQNNLNLIKISSLILDLASEPGGVDKLVCEKLGIKLVRALGIPGKIFPESAGEVLVKTVYKIISEENL